MRERERERIFSCEDLYILIVICRNYFPFVLLCVKNNSQIETIVHWQQLAQQSSNTHTQLYIVER